MASSSLDDSSTTTNISKNLFPISLIGTTIKLNDSNYLLWDQSFKVFVGAWKNIMHLLEAPQNKKILPIQTGLLMTVV